MFILGFRPPLISRRTAQGPIIAVAHAAMFPRLLKNRSLDKRQHHSRGR